MATSPPRRNRLAAVRPGSRVILFPTNEVVGTIYKTRRNSIDVLTKTFVRRVPRLEVFKISRDGSIVLLSISSDRYFTELEVIKNLERVAHD